MARQIELRDYQAAAIVALRDGIKAGHNSQILMAPTGGGKTVVAAKLMQDAYARRSRVAFMVDRVNLVNQTSDTLASYGIDHGVIQPDHWRAGRGYEPIQVCSAQTIEKRGFFPDLDLLIVDECHDVRQATADLIRNRPGLRVVGLSATPFSKGLAGLYTNLVNVCTTNHLIGERWLVPLKMYAAKATDMKGAKVVAGEWSDKEAAQRGMMIVGDVVSEWVHKTRLHFGGPVKTIVFSANVAHGEELCRQFSAAGYNFQQISHKNSASNESKDIIEEFRRPNSTIQGLVSCEVFTKGFDVPDILCGIAARPYRKSLSSHVQQLGRVMRPYPGKEFGLWLDHCGNLLRFREDTETLFQYGLQSLDAGALDAKPRSEPSKEEREKWTCSCGHVFQQPADACPACGKERVRRALLESVPGRMEAVGHAGEAEKKVEAFLEDKDSVWTQLCKYAADKKGDQAAARKFAYAQFRNIYGHWPASDYALDESVQVVPQLVKRVQHNLIKYLKGREGGAHAVS